MKRHAIICMLFTLIAFPASSAEMDRSNEDRELAATLDLKLAKLPPEKRLRGIFVIIANGEPATLPADAGVNDILKQAGLLLPGDGAITLERWLEWNPEIIVADSREREPLLKLLRRPEWENVPALRDARIHFFPRALLGEKPEYAAYAAAWISSMAYTDHFVDSTMLVHPEEVVKETPLAIDLPYVRAARIAESRIGDFIHRTLLVDFAAPQAVLSTADGWLDAVSTVGNSFSPTPMWAVNHHIGMKPSRANVFRVLGLQDGGASLLFTGADMNNLAVRITESDGIRVVALVTAGVESNAVRLSRDIGRYVEPGTINIIVMTNRALSPGAMATAVVTVTEAKTAALWDMDIRSSQTPRRNPATGTGTDGVLIVQGAGANANWVGGHARLGQLIAQAVHGAVQEALEKQNRLLPVRNVLVRLAERKIYLEQVYQVQLDDPSLVRIERLLDEPRYRGFVETAFALDDALVMGQGACIAMFEEQALRVAGEIAGRNIPRLHDFPDTSELPPALSVALRAFASGVGIGGGQ